MEHSERHGKEKSIAYETLETHEKREYKQDIAKGEISCLNFRVISRVSWAKALFRDQTSFSFRGLKF